MKQTTTIYLSGDGTFVEEFIRDKKLPNTGILLSYWTLRGNGRARQRLDRLIDEFNGGPPLTTKILPRERKKK